MISGFFSRLRSRLNNRSTPQHLGREALCVFFVSGIFFLLLAFSSSFPDPDSFYHARMAALMTRGPLLSFSWLPLTSLSTIFIDHHFLYHILLIPFVTFFDPLVGIKIATILFAAAFCTLFYLLERRPFFQSSISRSTALLFLFLLLINTVFAFRLNLAKIPAVSLFAFFLGLRALSCCNRKAIYAVSFLFVWLYGGWPLMPLAACIAWVSKTGVELPEDTKIRFASIVSRTKPLSHFKKTVSVYIRTLFEWKNISIPLLSFAGAASGLILNPYFPTNIHFYWLQTIKIAVLNVISDVPVGSEWYPAGMSFIPAHGQTLMILVFALCIFFLPDLFASYLRTRIPKRTWQGWMFCLLSLIFLVLTLKSRRYGEYFAPIATLFCAYTLSPILEKDQWKKFWNFLKRSTHTLYSFRGLTTAYFLIMIPAIISTNLFQIFGAFQGGYEMGQYSRGMAWVAQHTPEGTLIFHNRWDDFPVFFYYNQHNRYVSGLDPRFLLDKNKMLAEDYATMQKGEDFEKLYGYRSLCLTVEGVLGKIVGQQKNNERDDISTPAECLPPAEKTKIAQVIRSFGASIVVLTHLDDPQTKKIRELPGFVERYHDTEMVIIEPSQ